MSIFPAYYLHISLIVSHWSWDIWKFITYLPWGKKVTGNVLATKIWWNPLLASEHKFVDLDVLAKGYCLFQTLDSHCQFFFSIKIGTLYQQDTSCLTLRRKFSPISYYTVDGIVQGREPNTSTGVRDLGLNLSSKAFSLIYVNGQPPHCSEPQFPCLWYGVISVPTLQILNTWSTEYRAWAHRKGKINVGYYLSSDSLLQRGEIITI